MLRRKVFLPAYTWSYVNQRWELTYAPGSLNKWPAYL